MDSYNEIETIYKTLGDDIFLMKVPVELIADRKKIAGLTGKIKLLKELNKRVREKTLDYGGQTKMVINVFKNLYNKINDLDQSITSHLVYNFWLAYLLDLYDGAQVDLFNTISGNKLQILKDYSNEAEQYLKTGGVSEKISFLLDDIRFQVEKKYNSLPTSVVSKKKIKFVQLKIFDLQMIISFLWTKMDSKFLPNDQIADDLGEYFIDIVFN
jgi:hypothetical protein